LRRAARAGALEEQADDAVRVHADQLDVAAVHQQAGPQPIDDALDLGTQPLGEFGIAVHALGIGRSAPVVERGRCVH
jgi:hypothetical protein